MLEYLSRREWAEKDGVLPSSALKSRQRGRFYANPSEGTMDGCGGALEE